MVRFILKINLLSTGGRTAMAVKREYQADADLILARRHDLGADYWTTPDKRLIKGTPFSSADAALLLVELGMDPSEPVLRHVAELFFDAWREDGRFKLAPDGAIYPCQTITAANVLCHLGYASDARLKKTFRHLLEIQHGDGGWRCKKFSYGRGPETEFSNPGPTLTALNAFRFTDLINREEALDRALGLRSVLLRQGKNGPEIFRSSRGFAVQNVRGYDRRRACQQEAGGPLLLQKGRTGRAGHSAVS
jgi:hypothetical protein